MLPPRLHYENTDDFRMFKMQGRQHREMSGKVGSECLPVLLGSAAGDM